MLSCESVSAQWYLFPGIRKKRAAQQKTETVGESTADTLTVAPSEEEALPDYSLQGAYQGIFPEVLRVALVLPFQTDGKPSANFLEMYCGSLLAVQEFGSHGKEIELTVIDESVAGTPIPQSMLEENHLVIGPVTFADIRDAAALCPENRYIVSPLEPKAASLADSNHVIQAPVQWMRQADEIAKWVKEDMRGMDELVVFKDTVKRNIGEQTRYLLAKLDENGCRYRTLARISEFNPSLTGATRIIIASDRDSYINGMVRDLSVAASQKRSDIVLYGTSNVRGSLGVDIEHLHNLQTHYTTGYFINYEDPAVSRFILSYRDLFRAEPGQFAFQGYDTMHYFLGLLTEYGEQWYKKLSEYSEKGLQTDYRFLGPETVGNVNTAVRKVILGRDLSAIVVK